MDLWNLIQIDSWLKKLSRILTRINSWLNDNIQFHFTFGFVWPFWASNSSVFQKNWLESAHDQVVSRRLESNQPMTQAGFQELIQNQLMTQVDAYGTDSDRLSDSKSFPIFLFNSTHDSSEKKKLILRRFMLGLWVIPMSIKNVFQVEGLYMLPPKLG